MTQAMLEIHVERKTFAATTVLNHIHLQLQPRETVSLLGPSGCGKSTCCASSPAWKRTLKGNCSATPNNWPLCSRNRG